MTVSDFCAMRQAAQPVIFHISRDNGKIIVVTEKTIMVMEKIIVIMER